MVHGRLSNRPAELANTGVYTDNNLPDLEAYFPVISSTYTISSTR